MASPPRDLNSRQWFYAAGQQQFGPVGLAQLRAEIASGRISRDGLVWCDGMPSWQPASQIPGFLTAPPPPPGLAPAQPQRSAVAVPVAPAAHSEPHGYHTAILILTIIGGFLSLFIGGCTSTLSEQVARQGDRINFVQGIASQVSGGEVPGRVDTESLRSFGNNHFFLGVLEACLGIAGGIVAFRTFPSRSGLPLGDFKLLHAHLAGVSILLAALLTYSNTFAFLTSGILFGISAALCLLAKPSAVAS